MRRNADTSRQMGVNEFVKVQSGKADDFGIKGYTMLRPPPYDKSRDNRFAGEKNRDYMSLVVKRGEANTIGPGSYKPTTEHSKEIVTDPKRVRFYHSIEKN